MQVSIEERNPHTLLLRTCKKMMKIINNARKRGRIPLQSRFPYGEITKLVRIVLISRQAGLDGLKFFKK